MIKNFTPRLYQETIFATCISKNTLVVLPTGLGKTNIFLMVAAQRLTQFPNSKVLFLGPTRPLISQYRDVFLKHFEIDPEKIVIFTGHIKPEKRAELWKTSKIIFSTPQGLENDIISNRISLRDVSLIGFDEAHRAVKEYSYVWIAKAYHEKALNSRLIGLTASPGSDKETIYEVCKNLYIEDLEVKTHTDPQVKPYIQKTNLNYVELDLPSEFLKIKQYFDNCLVSKFKILKEHGIVPSADPKNISKKELLGIQGQLMGEISQGNREFDILKSVSLTAQCLKISHAVELLESQGVKAVYSYISNLFSQAYSTKVKAVQNLVKDIDFKSAFILIKRLVEKKIEHPKFQYLLDFLNETYQTSPSSKVIIFTQFRDSAVSIKDFLDKSNFITSKVFVGQQKKNGTGLSQKEQMAVLDDFRDSKFNTIIMTSVGEEGLDIPRVDKVIFFEPVPSVIRYIQRKGRTGRQEEGDVTILMAKKTRDEIFRWSTKHKKTRMYSVLKSIKKEFILNTTNTKNNNHTHNNNNNNNFSSTTKTLNHYDSSNSSSSNSETKKISHLNTNPSSSSFTFLEKKKSLDSSEIKIYVDSRENSSKVVKDLYSLNLNLLLKKLDVGDYILSNDVAIEYKTVDDFVDSILDGRLISQLIELKRNFSKPLVLIEGEKDIYTTRNIHPNAINGMLSTIAVNFRIPLLFTKNSKESSNLIYTIAKREQIDSVKDFNPHTEKKMFNVRDSQEYILSSLPNIGPNVGKALLREFGTIKNIVTADENQLQNVPKIGKKKASELYSLFNQNYNKPQ
jgi:ERCC4-related helicase/ERCC4-type nuclease